MGRDEVERQIAVERYRRGESAEAICASTGRSKSWLYKWVERAEAADGEQWWNEQSRRPHASGAYAADERELIIATRGRLEAEGNFTGAEMIAWELECEGHRIPSLSTIKRILRSAGMTQKARRVPKGTRYPAPPALRAGAVQQADFVGPRHVNGIRFYSLNAVDVATARAAVQPIRSRHSEAVIPAFWSIWTRLGIPETLQVDNDVVFFGNRRSPRAMGQLLRLCFEVGVEVLFIPIREPWRNSVVEKFNDHWNRKLYRRIRVASFEALESESLSFEQRHNRTWRYSKLAGRTPNAALARSDTKLRLPPTPTAPSKPYARPACGRVSVVRLIRSDATLEVFGERFSVPREAVHEYVKATIDLGSRTLTMSMHGRLLDRVPYEMP